MRLYDVNGVRPGVVLAASVLVLLGRFAGAADTVCLKNGDRVSGAIERVGDGEVVITTPYAGTLTIDLEAVDKVTRDGEPLEAPEAEAPEVSEPKLWTGTISLGASARSGETDTVDASFGGSLARTRPKHTLTLEFGGGYTEADSRVHTRRLEGSGKWQYHPWERFYVFTTAGADHDPGTKLELRMGGGLGLGYTVIKRDRQTLSLDLGLDYAHERWNERTIQEREKAKRDVRTATRSALYGFVRERVATPLWLWPLDDLRTGLRLSHEALTADVEKQTHSEDHLYLRLAADWRKSLFKESVLSEKLALFPKIDDLGEYRVTSDLAFDTPLTDRLTFRLNLQSDYDSETGSGEALTSHTLTTAIRYAF